MTDEHHLPLVRPDAPFAEALREAIRARRFTLTEISRRLGAAGQPVAVATLSSWQNRTRVPQRSSSAAIATLEHVLQLPDRWLSDRLLNVSERRSGSDRAWLPAIENILGDDMRLYSATRNLSVIDRFRLDRSGCIDSLRSLRLVQAVAPTRHVVVAQFGEEGATADEMWLAVLTGARSIALRRSGEAPMTVGIVDLGRTLRPGETALVEVEARDGNRIPSHEYFMMLDDDVHYLLEVGFNPAHLPTRLASFHAANPGSGRVEHGVRLSPDHRAHMLRAGGPASVAGISWTWAAAAHT